MLFCTCTTQVYEITNNIKVNACYSVHVPHKFMRSLKIKVNVCMYMYHTSL